MANTSCPINSQVTRNKNLSYTHDLSVREEYYGEHEYWWNDVHLNFRNEKTSEINDSKLNIIIIPSYPKFMYKLPNM